MQCKEPSLKGNTIGELVRHIVELRGSIDDCNNRMLSIDRSIDEYDKRYTE
nr:MAG TPA: DegQ (SacQ) family [Caudoviricetes sp.]